MRQLAITISSLLAATLLAAPAAEAAFPGSNGRIYVRTDTNGTPGVKSVLPDGTGLRDEPGFPARFSLSPDGRRIAFVRGSVPNTELVVRDIGDPIGTTLLPQGDVRAPFGEADLAPPAWSRDGELLALPARKADFSGLMVVVPVDGGPVRQFYPYSSQSGDRAFALGQSFSPAGGEFAAATIRKVSFPNDPTNNSGARDCVASIERFDQSSGSKLGDVTPLTSGPNSFDPCVNDSAPDYTPDGSQIVFLRNVREGIFVHPPAISRVSANGGAATTITTLTLGGSTFKVAPEGDELAYLDAGSQSGTNAVRAIPVSGGASRPVIEIEGAVGVLAWAPGATTRITGGPSGLTRDRTASFTFERPDDPRAGALECRLDGAAAGFTPCTSPKEITGLADGSHLFEVRFAPSSGPPDPPVSAGWDVDGTAPVTKLVSGPSGTGNGPDAEIAWESADTDVERFQCQLDGGPAFTCASPHRLTGLSPGQHRFAIAAVDRAGNVESPAAAEVTWEVAGEQAPATLQCATPTATAGVLTAIAREEAACWQPDTVEGRPAQVSTGAVSANGIRIDPAPGTRIIVAPQFTGGSLRITGPATLSVGAVRWPVNGPLEWNGLVASQVAQVPKLFDVVQQEIGGMPLTASPSVELSADNGGQAKLALKVALPKAFKTVPGRPPPGTPESQTGFKVDVALTTSNDKGVTFGGRITLAEAWLFGRVKVKDLSLGGDTATNTFDGTVTLELAQAGRLAPKAISKDAAVTFGVTLAPADLVDSARTPLGALRRLSAQVGSFEKHIGEGFYLQRFGAELGTGKDATGKPAITVAGNVGLSFGPKLQFDNIFEGELMAMDGKGTLTVPTDDASTAPVTFEATGDGKLVDLPVSSATVKLETTPRVSFTARQGIDIGGFGVDYGITDGFFDPGTLTYNARGTGRVRLPLLGEADGEVVQSSTGIAACIQLGSSARVGFGKRWTDPASPFQVFGSACDLGPFAAAAPAAAGAGGDRTVDVARGTPILAIEVRGADAAPHVTLRPPGGGELASPLRRRGVLLAEDPAGRVTYVLVEKPRPGRWTVSGDGIAGLRTARARPAVKVRARVARGRLTWKLTAQRGQRVTFAERGAHTARTILTTTRSRGSVRFRPASSIDRKRTIEALVVQNGVPRRRVVAARVTARPAVAGKVSALRRAARGRVAWRGSAPTYAVSVLYADGEVVTASTSRPRLTVRRRGTVTVTVVPLGADGVPGRAVRKRLKL